jgi:hypothetical protein
MLLLQQEDRFVGSRMQMFVCILQYASFTRGPPLWVQSQAGGRKETEKSGI